MSPDNCISVIMSETDNGYRACVKFSKKPELNYSLEEEFGKETVLPAELGGGKSITTKTGNVFVSKITYQDVVYTHESTLSSFGMSNKITSSRDGYISTSVWERVKVSFCGFFVMESHVDADKFMVADAKISKAEAETMMSYAALKVTEKNGMYEMIDYLGNGKEQKVSFQLGVEFQDDYMGFPATHLFTSNSPAELICTSKEKNGNMSVWKGYATSDQFVWSVESASHGVKCSITYKRCGDVEGTWRLVTHSNYDNFLRGCGLDESMVKGLVDERSSFSFHHVGKGVYLDSTTSKVFPMEPKHTKPGEESSFQVGGMNMCELYNFTRDGMIGTVKIGSNIMTYKWVSGKELGQVEQEVVGKPFTKCTMIYARA